MKKLILILCLFATLYSFGQAGYTTINSRYNWLAGKFRALNLPSGPVAVLATLQPTTSDGIFLDTLDGDGSPRGLYLFQDGAWVFQGTGSFDQADKLLSGGSVSYTGTGLKFNVTQSVARLCNIIYPADSIQVTLPAADPTFNKQYVIYLDSTGVNVLEGVPGTPAAVPQLEACQLALTTVLVEAGQTVPAITTQVIYDENTESTVANTGTTTNGGNATNVFTGVFSTQVTNVTNNDTWTWTKVSGGYWSLVGVNTISLAVLLRQVMVTGADIRIQFFNGASAVSGEVIIAVNKNNASTYQQISIPISALGTITNTNFNVVRIRYTRPGSLAVHTGFYFDRLELVSGLPVVQPGSAVTSIGITTNGDAITVGGSPVTSTGNIALNYNGTVNDYINGLGNKITFPSIPNIIGPINSRAKNDDGLTYDGDSLFTHTADRYNNGMMSKEDWIRLNRGDSIQNTGDGDTLVHLVNDSTIGIKSLKIIGGTISSTNTTVTINVVGGGVTAGEGTVISGDSVHVGGLIGSPSLFQNERTINLNRKIIHLTNGVAAEAGGAYWQFSYRPFSPYQLISQDTVTVDNAIQTIDRPLSGLFARRTVYFNPSIYKTQQSYGHYLGQTYNFADSMVARTDGGDYQQAVIAELRIKPRGTGRQVFRTGHGTNGNLQRVQGVAALVGNFYMDGDGTNPLRLNGTGVGIAPYLVMFSGTTDTIDNFVYIQPSSFVGGGAKVRKSFILAPAATAGVSEVDSAFFLYDIVTRERSYIAGSILTGEGDSTVTQAQFRVNGSSLFNGWSGYWANVAANYTARSFTDKNYVDSAIAAGSGGGFFSPNQTSTSATLHNGGAFNFQFDGTYGNTTMFRRYDAFDDARIVLGGAGVLELIHGTQTVGRGYVQVSSGGVAINARDSSTSDFSEITVYPANIYFDAQAGNYTFTDIRDSVAGTNYMLVYDTVTDELRKAPLPSASGGSGTVNSGTANRLSYYASTGTAVSELAAITASRALVSDANGLPVAATTTTTQLNYLGSATGTTGTTSTNLVFSTSPTITTPTVSGAIITSSAAQTGTNASGTGTIPYEFHIMVRSDETLTNTTSDQNLFGSGHDVITVLANTTYKFKLVGDLTHGATSHSIAIGFTPTTAVVTNIAYNAMSWVSAVGTGSTVQTTYRYKTTSTNAISAIAANATETFVVEGWITIGATGGTITPQIKFSTDPTGTILLKAGAAMHIYAIGNDTFTETGPIN